MIIFIHQRKFMSYYGHLMKIFIKISNFWAWANKFWDIWGIFDPFISTHFGTVSPKYPFGMGFEFGLQRIRDLAFVCP